MSKVLFIAGNTRSLIANRGDLIALLKDMGHDVYAIVPEYDFMSDIDRLGINYDSMNINRASLNIVTDIRGIAQMYRYIKEVKPDIIYAYTIKPIVYGLILSSVLGVRKKYAMITGLGYMFIGGSVIRQAFGKLARLVYKISLRQADAVFFQNIDDYKLFVEKNVVADQRKSVIVNGSGVNMVTYEYEQLEKAKKFRFLMISRLLIDKGVEEYFHAAKEIVKSYDNVEFYLVGPVDYNLPHSISTKMYDEIVADQSIEMLPEVSDVRPLIRSAHTIVLPSYREGTPRSVLEAMSMGRPIITTDVPGCRETVVNSYNGYLVKSKSVESLVQAMTLMVRRSHEELVAMGQASRQIVENKYDVNLVNKAIVNEMDLAL